MPEKPTHITIVEKGVHELQPGEMTLYPVNHYWYLGCPATNCGVAVLSGHTITQNGSDITVSPSILCGCGAHYFVEHNQIRWC